MRAAILVVLAAFVAALGSGVVACVHGASEPGRASEDVALAGVDTKDLTARERHEFSQFVRVLPAPCASVAVPVADCVLERRPCVACVRAAQSLAQLVREGMSHEQVETTYKRRFDPASAKSIPVEGSPARGPTDARVVVVEFADFECPFCQQMADVLDAMWETRKDRVRFVYKFMPLSMHPHSEIAARAAIAADAQSKFWAMHHELFTNAHHLEQGDVERYAETIGLDIARFRSDAQSAATTARLDADRKLADSLGVKGTPTIFVDGRECDAPANIAEWVDSEL